MLKPVIFFLLEGSRFVPTSFRMFPKVRYVLQISNFFVIITLTELQKLKSKNLVIQVLVYFATGENCQEFHTLKFQK